jgi:hypothetical protein
MELNYASAGRPEMTELRGLLTSLPPIECHYRIERSGGEGFLAPSPALEVLRAQWTGRVVVYKPDLAMVPTGDPKPPRSEGEFLRFGGKEEAWLYRVGFLASWEKCGALALARGPKRPRTSG